MLCVAAALTFSRPWFAQALRDHFGTKATVFNPSGSQGFFIASAILFVSGAMLAFGCAVLAIFWERKQNLIIALLGVFVVIAAVPLANASLNSYTKVDAAKIKNSKEEVRISDVREVSITCQPHSNNELGISIIAETATSKIAIWKTSDAGIPNSDPNFSSDMHALQKLIDRRGLHVTNNALFACASGLPVTEAAKDQFAAVTEITSGQ